MSEQFKKPDVSVAICTHNPRKDYLQRALEALRAQTISKNRWELLLIDNSSSEQLAEKWDLSWHPHGRHVREEEVGLTAARLRAMREAKTDLILFMDDDNVVFPDYLEQGLKISKEWPLLGTWGGQWIAEYEHGIPKDWKEDPWSTHFKRDLWSNHPDYEVAPFGGGMFVRGQVSEAYIKSCEANPLKRKLDRAGGVLSSYGDFDIAFCGCDIGLGMGRFVALRLIHLIPATRTTLKYRAKLIHDSACSLILFKIMRGTKMYPPTRIERFMEFYKELRMKMCKKDISLVTAERRGRNKAWALLKQIRPAALSK